MRSHAMGCIERVDIGLNRALGDTLIGQISSEIKMTPVYPGACYTAKSPHGINQPEGPNPPLIQSHNSPRCYNDAQSIRSSGS